MGPTTTTLTLTLTILLLLYLSTTISSSSDESSVMSTFKTTLRSPPSSWSDSNHCKWGGITCDSSNQITDINLNSLSLSGSLPSNLNSLTHLKSLSLQRNHLSGTLPSFANLASLQTLFLDSNNFTSIAPAAFSGLTNLQTLSITDNPNLHPWVFPHDLVASSTIVSIYANNVNMFGSIPDIFGSFQSLKDLRLSYNNLTGGLPTSFNASNLQNLWLNNQLLGLSGSLQVISGMTQLGTLWVQNNKFSGTIPDLSNCQQLSEIRFRDNQLTGFVPQSLVNLHNLVNVTLQNNLLQGPLPVFGDNVYIELGVWDKTNRFCRNVSGECDPQVTTLLLVAKDLGFPVKLADVWVGNDACNDWSYINCDLKRNVVSVNLQKQGFTGSISLALANLTSLRELYLNDNNLTGTIPSSLTGLSQLRKIDLSNNDLSGKPPIFRSGVSVSLGGNKNIGHDVPTPGGAPGSESGSSSSGSGRGSNGSSISAGVIVGLVIAVIVFIMVVLFVSYKCYVKRRLRKFGKVQNPEVGNEMGVKTSVMPAMNGYAGVPSELQSQSSGGDNEFPVYEGGHVAISIQVIRQVTNNFSEDNILGRGGFGVVYKGELHDGTKIAVKRMEAGAMGTKGMNEFQAEIGVLTKVRHRHLVALLGFCVNGNERLLVYEYMPQGHLGQHVFDWQEHGYPPLTWKQRVTIALDVARGVEYLHSLARTSFIHRDLKPSNILLGDDMRAKVADFGLVKNAPDGKYSVETRLAGTFGYLAPEYAVTGRVTTKIDVYAFGVILMELITGRKALDESLPDERSHLVTWFRRILVNKENLGKAIDGVLDPDEETYESISRVAELAGHCTGREPQQRPDMGHAVNVLGPLVEEWKPCCQEEQDRYGIDVDMSLPQALQRWQADEGTSTMISDMSFSRTQGSIPAKPSGFADSFDSMDCR